MKLLTVISTIRKIYSNCCQNHHVMLCIIKKRMFRVLYKKEFVLLSELVGVHTRGKYVRRREA